MASYKKLIVLVINHLSENETIIHSAYGAYEVVMFGNSTLRNGILVATNQRLVFFAKKLGGFDFETFPYPNISSIESSKNLLGGKISFFAVGNKVTIKWINEGDPFKLVEYVSRVINQASKPVDSNNLNIDIPTQIKKLDELRNLSLLSDDEFNEKKKELLERM